MNKQIPSFYIGNRLVSENSSPLVIAEIGINHNGSLKIAKEMVDAAHEAGVEIIKHGLIGKNVC